VLNHSELIKSFCIAKFPRVNVGLAGLNHCKLIWPFPVGVFPQVGTVALARFKQVQPLQTQLKLPCMYVCGRICKESPEGDGEEL